MNTLRTAEPSRKSSPTARAQGLSHLVFERPDLDRSIEFLRCFGLTVVERRADSVFLRGALPQAFCYEVRRGPRARFVGFGLSVASRADLQALTALSSASPIIQLNAPGGGECVRVVDPSGFVVEAIYGQAPSEGVPFRQPLSWNTGGSPSRINATQRPSSDACTILKLGHVVLEVALFQSTSAFYTQHFGFIPSDVQALPDGSPAVVFMRLDRGDVPTDHHTLAIAQGVTPVYSHSAYEVIDVDEVAVGKQLLQRAGFRHAWGIGRHILGSQVFDYWYDPDGDKHEHYCDGDLFTATHPMGTHEVSRDAMAQWGPTMPASFARPKLSPQLLNDVIRGLRTSPDLTVAKLRMLQKIFG